MATEFTIPKTWFQSWDQRPTVMLGTGMRSSCRVEYGLLCHASSGTKNSRGNPNKKPAVLSLVVSLILSRIKQVFNVISDSESKHEFKTIVSCMSVFIKSMHISIAVSFEVFFHCTCRLSLDDYLFRLDRSFSNQAGEPSSCGIFDISKRNS